MDNVLLLFGVPALLVVLLLAVFFFGRKGRAGPGLGDRRDSAERRELRGTEQSQHRPEFGGHHRDNRPPT